MITVSRLPGNEAFDLIYPEYLAMLPSIQQETMHRSMANSSRVQVYSSDGKILCFWGLIPPTLLSDCAYLWLYTTENMQEHVFSLVRHSQRAVEEMLQDYPIIVGHGVIGATKSLRWLRWLGARFGEPQGKLLPFEIRAESWPQR